MSMRIGGLASGMDIDMLVKQLMQAERAPLNKLYQKRQTLEWQRDAYREVNRSLSKFRDAYAKLRLQSTFSGYSATSSNANVVSAKATMSAIPGTYKIEVVQLAKVASVTSANALKNASNENAKANDKVLSENDPEFSFQIETAKGTATITVTRSDTFATLAQKIQNATNSDKESLGLRANFDNTTSRFFISAKEPGDDSWFQFKVIDDGDEDTSDEEFVQQFIKERILGDPSASSLKFEGQNAKVNYTPPSGNMIVVDNLKSNTFTINGVEFNLHTVSSEPMYVKVASDPEGIINTIKDFVEKYNELVDQLSNLITEPKYRDYPPLTEEQKEEMKEKEIELWEKKAKSGLLRNDPIITNFLNQMRRAIYDPIEGIPANELHQISKIGITTGNYLSGGKLEIDEDKLRAAVLEDPDGVMKLFTKSAEKNGNTAQMGIGQRIYATLNTTLSDLRDKAGSPGYTSGDQSLLGKSIYTLNDQISDWEVRLAKIESRYWSQFTAMEEALNKMNQQSLWMQQNLLNSG